MQAPICPNICCESNASAFVEFILQFLFVSFNQFWYQAVCYCLSTWRHILRINVRQKLTKMFILNNWYKKTAADYQILHKRICDQFLSTAGALVNEWRATYTGCRMICTSQTESRTCCELSDSSLTRSWCCLTKMALICFKLLLMAPLQMSAKRRNVILLCAEWY